MASNEEGLSGSEGMKSDYGSKGAHIKFKCCVKKTSSTFFCINCEEVYHGGCAKRKNIKFIGKSRVMCCEVAPKDVIDGNVNKENCLFSKYENDKLTQHISLLNRLLNEMSDKNIILKENNNLLNEKNEFLIQKITNLESKLVTSKSPPLSNVAEMEQDNRSSNSCRLGENNRTVGAKAGGTNRFSKLTDRKRLGRVNLTPNKEHQLNINKNIINRTNIKTPKSTSHENLNIVENPIINAITAKDNSLPLPLAEDEGNCQEASKRKPRYPKIERPLPVRGGIEDDFQLIAAKKTSFLFLSGLSPNTTVEQVENYIKNKLDVSCKCDKMKTRKDYYRSSFKLEVPVESKVILMSPDIWGKGIVINHFLHLRRRPVYMERREVTS